MLFIACSFLLLAGCGSQQSSDSNGDPDTTSIKYKEFKKYETDSAVIVANNQFGFDAYQRLESEEEDKNIFISPLSIQQALAMTYNGAAGETKQEMAKALKWTDVKLESLNESNAALLYQLTNADPSVQLSIANSIWKDEGEPFKQPFLDTNKQYYQAKVETLDFDSDEASETMNDWVKENTNGKIKKIVPSQINPLTVMFLINAIHFKGDWQTKFQENKTSTNTFHLADGSTKQHPFMNQEGDYAYTKMNDMQMIRLPYGEEGRFGMVVLLPDKNHSLTELFNSISAENVGKWTDALSEQKGKISIPRFTFEYEKKLNNLLQNMGMEQAFDERANFENLAPVPPDLYISNVKHKSFIEVNEKGTEAAAATSVEATAESAPSYDFTMNVDRPFMFMIQDQKTETVLFLGSVQEPKEE